MEKIFKKIIKRSYSKNQKKILETIKKYNDENKKIILLRIAKEINISPENLSYYINGNYAKNGLIYEGFIKKTYLNDENRFDYQITKNGYELLKILTED